MARGPAKARAAYALTVNAVIRIVESGRATVAADWFHAAMVMQHGRQLSDFQRAHEWAERAADLGLNEGPEP